MRKQWNSKQRFSLRKFSTGLASVLLATMFMSQGVMAQTNEVNEKPNDTEEVVKPDNNNAVTTVQPKATENVVDGKVQAAGNVREEAEGSVVSTPGKNIGETLIKGAENTILNMEESNQKEKLTDNKPLSGNVIESQNNKELPEEESENNISKEKIDTKKLNDLISAVEKENKNNLPTTFKNEITEEINKAKLVLKDAKTQEEINKEITVLEGLKTRIEEANKPKRRGRRSERELTDVNIGLVKRGNISDDIIRVAPGGMNYVGSVLQVKAESRSDNIIDVTVDGAHGFMGHKVAGIGTKTVTVSFEGDTPGSGNYAITVTVKTAKGSKSFTFGHYTTLPKPTIETPDTDLTGKADKKPTVKIKANTTPPSSFVGGAKLRAYLIRNGADSTSYGGQSYGAYPEGYTILASKDVDASGNAEITESDYIVGKIGAGKVKAITVIELPNKVNDISVGERGSFISNERTVTAVAKVNKTDLETLVNGAAEKRKTHEYYNAAKTARDTYDNAIAAATTVLNKENVTQDEINAEKDKVDAALGGLTGAATNKNDLETLVNGAEAKRKTHEYYNADPSKQEAYDNAIKAAAEVLKKDNVTQSEINTEKNNVNTALQGLTGAETNKTALDAALSEEATTKASAAYYNATSDKKTAYDNAVELGKAIFNRTDATQTEVNDAVTAIANVKNALNGKETNHSQSDNNMMKALLAKKEEAKMLIEQEAMKKKAEISQAELSESEKALLDARVDQEKAKAFQMIDQVTTIEEVDQVLKAGIEVIRSIAVASANGRMTDVTPEESEAAMAQAHRQALPQTGTGNEVAIFGAAASAILAGLGLVVPSKKKED